ncbi:Bug family tripartite tricarboxylate transporter substrate binding protein [Salinicola lusitanus]|uniref:Tripartite tricarboxylate transporter substrate binding protein n=1 Tax=Salinicola lusitanus TaxID=1949085 RepID=A0ABZ3CVX6_9GAMM|nr:tripartite tricarboxylate transporter substrate binding protein [Salinicola lusitanus]
MTFVANLSRPLKGLAVGLAVLSTLTMAAAGPARADGDYPSQPIRLVVPFGPGGSTDLAARVLAKELPPIIGADIAVINVPGAGGAVGTKQVIDSAADGYTLLMAAIGSNVLRPALNPDLPYHYDDVTYLGRTQINPNVLIVRNGTYADFAEFQQALETRQGKLRYGTAGVGQVTHLGPILLYQALDIPTEAATPVHYDSDPAAMLALMQGEVDFVQANLPSVASAIQGDQVKALAVTTPERIDALPDVPTYTELGLPDVSIVGWRGVAGPKDLPQDVVDSWNRALAELTRSDAWLEATRQLGDDPAYLNGADFTEFAKQDFERYRAIGDSLGLTH